MTENNFKTGFDNHKLSFRNRNHSHDTVLSKYIWELKDNDTTYVIKWRIIKRANAYKGKPSRWKFFTFLETLYLECPRAGNQVSSREQVLRNQSQNTLFQPSIIIIIVIIIISIGNSMICNDIWHKYHEWYFEIVISNFTSLQTSEIWDNFEISRVVFTPNITYKSCYYLFILLPTKGL